MAWLLHWFDFDGLLQSIAAVSVVYFEMIKAAWTNKAPFLPRNN